MRHLGSLVLCLLVAALVYLLVGTSDAKWVEAQTTSGAGHYTALALMIAAAVSAGGLYGLLVLARLSPVGTVFAGLAFLAVAFWAFFASSSFEDLMPDKLLGVDGAAERAAGPVSIVLATPLLLTIFSPRRWRRWGNPPAAVAPAPDYSPSPMSPGYESSFSSTPPYAPGSPSYGSEPASPAGSYAAPGSPLGFPPPPPYTSGDDPESTRRL